MSDVEYDNAVELIAEGYAAAEKERTVKAPVIRDDYDHDADKDFPTYLLLAKGFARRCAGE